MSLLGTARCAHKSRVNVGRARGGIQQRKCTRCGDLENHRVRSCLFFHSWRNAGRPKYGRQGQKCRRCDAARVREVRPCWLMHRWSARGLLAGRLRCVRCGIAG